MAAGRFGRKEREEGGHEVNAIDMFSCDWKKGR